MVYLTLNLFKPEEPLKKKKKIQVSGTIQLLVANGKNVPCIGG